MDRLIHTALTGLRSAMARQSVTANNVANASTVGFRAEMTAARTMWITGQGMTPRPFNAGETSAADMRGGTVNQTGRDLDIALNADALLAVQAEDGSEAYTRRGDLQVSASGLVTTGDGRPVLGEAGPLTLPPADSVRIADDGVVWIVPTGGDPNTPQQVDRLKLVTPAGSQIQRGEDSLFRVANGGALPSDPAARVTPRSLESSNVQVSQALIDMIDASRAWDTQLNLVTSARDLDTAASELMRLPN